jgi:broad specificity phosphatase PhoE
MYKNPYAKLKPKTKSPYTEIFLIRHCHPDYTLEKSVGDRLMPLSAYGLKQRAHLTKRLLKMKIDKVYISSLLRAQESAAIYLKKAKKRSFIDSSLDEIDWKHWMRIKYFNMSEKMREKRFKKYRQLDRDLDKMQIEVRRVLSSIYKGNVGKKIAIFSHGNFIKTVLTGILNADIIGFLSLEVFQSSITKIVIDKEGYIKIVYINDINHLPTPIPDRDIFITLQE